MAKRKHTSDGSAANPKGTRLQVGDHVVVTIGLRRLHARVIEDRGSLGVGGRQIVRIEIAPTRFDDGEAQRLEWPAEELVRESPAA